MRRGARSSVGDPLQFIRVTTNRKRFPAMPRAGLAIWPPAQAGSGVGVGWVDGAALLSAGHSGHGQSLLLQGTLSCWDTAKDTGTATSTFPSPFSTKSGPSPAGNSVTSDQRADPSFCSRYLRLSPSKLPLQGIRGSCKKGQQRPHLCVDKHTQV